MLGFVNADNVGGVGLEAKYNDVLEGTAGMTVTAKNGVGTDLLYQYEQYYDAENGNSLVLTMDVEVQSYLEKGLESMIDKFGCRQRCYRYRHGREYRCDCRHGLLPQL